MRSWSKQPPTVTPPRWTRFSRGRTPPSMYVQLSHEIYICTMYVCISRIQLDAILYLLYLFKKFIIELTPLFGFSNNFRVFKCQIMYNHIKLLTEIFVVHHEACLIFKSYFFGSFHHPIGHWQKIYSRPNWPSMTAEYIHKKLSLILHTWTDERIEVTG